jgi:hypothetical protein
MNRPQDHSAAGLIKSTEKSNDLSGNRTRDLQTCSVVPQPTTLPRPILPYYSTLSPLHNLQIWFVNNVFVGEDSK